MMTPQSTLPYRFNKLRAQKKRETAAAARRGEQRVDELTYHSPYRRRRRPFAAGASNEACACACKVDENDGNCQ